MRRRSRNSNVSPSVVSKHTVERQAIPLQESHTQENGQELDQKAIGVWKYVRTGINTYLKNQVKNYSKIDNSVKYPKVQNIQV